MSDVCAFCGGDYHVALRTPDMDIQPVPICAICAVMGFDWQERLGVKRIKAGPGTTEEQ